MSGHVADPAAFLDSTPLVPLEIAPDGRVRYVGAQGEALLGHPIEEWYEAGFWERSIVLDDRDTVAQARRHSADARGRHEIDYRMERADSRVIWVAELLTYQSEGATLRGFLWNVTGRKRQEITLWRNEERLRRMLRRAPDALVLIDELGSVLNMNEQAEALFGYELRDIVGSSVQHLLPEGHRHRLGRLLAAFEADGSRRTLLAGESLAIQRNDGTEIPVELSLGRVTEDGEGVRILCSLRDLTVRRRIGTKRPGAATRSDPSDEPDRPPA
ncbi:MAG: PAS domain S-box protein [Longimicrobiales bacterium]|nr:PAS domain S-box protein [Longimicrobiales bacterium]